MKDFNKHINQARIAKLENIVNQKTGLAPFLLFPLRLETHFRQANVNSKPLYEEKIDRIFRSFSALLNQLQEFSVLLKTPEEKSIQESLYDLRITIEELDLTSKEDKNAIFNISSSLLSAVQSIFEKEQLKKIESYFVDIQRIYEEIETSGALKRNKTTVFIRDLQKSYTALETLSEYTKTAYRSTAYYEIPDHKSAENRNLYRHVTGKILNVSGFFMNALKELKQLPAIDNRQRTKLVKSLYANNFIAWEKLLNQIAGNMEKLYQDFDFQQKKLMKKFNEEWISHLKEVKKNCEQFNKEFDKIITEKPFVANSYVRTAQNLIEFQIKIWEAGHRQELIKYNQLAEKMENLNHLLENTYFIYSAEKSLIKDLATHLTNRITDYSLLMNQLDYADYSSSEKNKKLSNFKVDISSSPHLLNEQKQLQNQLCVRIFPDDIFIHQHDDLLTNSELKDAKDFWLKWFIASNNETYEREAWDYIWRKYGVMRASWMARCLRPHKIEEYKDRKPFLNNREMEDNLEDLIEIINDLELQYDAEKEGIEKKKEKQKNEQAILNTIHKMLPKFYKVREIVMQYDLVVDYLYKNLTNDLNYIQRRLKTVFKFYERHEAYKIPENMDYRDRDFLALTSFNKELEDLMQQLAGREVSLEKMLKEYYKNLEKEDVFFPVMEKTRADDEIIPPTSAILPNRFIFIGFTKLEMEGKLVEKKIVYAGKKVKKNLVLGFNPGEDPEINPYEVDMESGEMNVRGGIKWMTDYQTAENSGMAISVPLPHNDEEFKAAKFEQVYVLGIKNQSDEKTLESFLNGHLYGESHLDFLNFNTPTNSLDDVVTGYNSDESLLESRRYEIDVLENFKNKNNALFKSLHQVFGIDKNSFDQSVGRVNNFDNQEIEKAEKTNRLLSDIFKNQFSFQKDGSQLAATLNNFLRSTPDFITKHCFSRGIIPPLRIGNQPYGILPTTAFSKFDLDPTQNIPQKTNKDELDFAKKLYQLLKKLTHIWEETKNKYVIHSENLTKGNPEKRYMEMMGLTPVSVSYFERSLVEAIEILHAPGNYLGLNKKIGLGKIIKDIFGSPLEEAGVSNEAVLNQLPIFYGYPVENMVEEFKDKTSAEPSLQPLIEKLFSEAQKNELLKIADEQEIPYLIAEFLDLFTHRLDAWWLGLVNYQLSRIRNGDFGKSGSSLNFGAFGWLFNLEKRKDKQPVSIQKQKQIVNLMKSSDQDTPIYQDAEHNEFILAPSHQHAVTAAILRSGYNKRKKSDEETEMSVNLSSLRVRQAIRIIDGIRNGLSMGAILGADLERALHEAYKSPGNNELDRYILPLRKLFPLKIDLKSQQENETEDTYQMSLINGELLLNSISYEDDTKTMSEYLLGNSAETWFHNLFQNTPNKDQHKKQVAYLIEHIGDAVDALSDLILSEGVYQLVQGNRVAFKAWMESLTDGNFNSSPMVSEFPMHGATITHQVGLALETKNLSSQDWAHFITYENDQGETILEEYISVFAEVEPHLNNWIAEILGAAKNIKFAVEIQHLDSSKDFEIKTSSLGEMGISPLEYVFLTENIFLFSRFLILKYRSKNNLWNADLKLNLDEVENLENDERALNNDRFVLKNLRMILANCRSLNAEDLSRDLHLEGDNLKGYNLSELKQRVDYLIEEYEEIDKQLKNTLQNFPLIQENEENEVYQDFIRHITELMIQLTAFGMMDAMISFPEKLWILEEESKTQKMADLKDYLLEISKKVQNNLREARNLRSQAMEDEDAVVSVTEKIVQHLTMKSFRIIPRFSVEQIPGESIDNCFIQMDPDFSYENVNPMKIEDWLREISKVRKTMKNFHSCRMFADFNTSKEETFSIIQFPFQETKDKEWLGIEVSSEDLVEDKESLFLIDAHKFSASKNSFAGIIIDRWMELIPYTNQSGSVVFNYDNPDAEAPQSILLAIPSKIKIKKRGRVKNWTLDDLLTTLQDTKKMMEIRAVEPDHFYHQEEFSKVLPLLKYDYKNS